MELITEIRRFESSFVIFVDVWILTFAVFAVCVFVELFVKWINNMRTHSHTHNEVHSRSL